jgi:SAM-dependent methyltransferase
VAESPRALDAHYSDARMARRYDALNATRDDIDFYAALAGVAPLRVLDIGGGTGQLARQLAGSGHRVTVLDPAAAMMAAGRQQPGGDAVEWLLGTVAELPADARYDFIVMSGHVFQVFLTDDDIAGVVRAAREHLAPAGRLAFECRNPLARGWERWTRARARRVVATPDGDVETYHRLLAVDEAAGFVSFEQVQTHLASGQRLTSQSTLRFATRERIEALLREAGFDQVDCRGTWDGRAVDASSPELIFIAS